MSQSLRSRLARSAVVVLLLAAGAGLPACEWQTVSTEASGSAASLNDAHVGALMDALAEASSHGFRPGAFGEQGLAEALRRDEPQARARLREAVLAYASALHGRAIPTAAFEREWGVKRPAYDAEAAFTSAMRDGRLKDWLEDLAPRSPQYQGLRAGYAVYARTRAVGGWPPLSAPVDLRLGDGGPFVVALRDRLAVEDASAAQAATDGRFDPALAEAVRRAQQRYGLSPTGVVDADTLAALNVPVEARLAQIRANLERLRWLPREAAPSRIEVNTAAGLVDVYRDGEPVLRMLAAAGKPGDETPILVSAVHTVVLNPTWNVPDSIADAEILPKGGAYLQRLGFVHNPPGMGVKLTQRPGPENALGRVKFVFDNAYAVYLHDTPARAAFAREQRSVSHGCVRLARAVDLAHLLLATQPGWSPQRIDQVLAGGETTEVRLGRPVPVNLLYLTAFSAGGALSFRPDVYGWDAAVLRRLDARASGPA